ncbi:isocitrate lyase/PEP mutase family protein [Pseudooceanicola nanhaiensis]|uniref:isocitrate lyase/PEP mutase family protein n=1 Tax=Pseudooceanicola nanhaiensis TaxID=375761 RepID=UPI001CD5EC20|nr:isocitrate lyase/PEP mutase family protein [Pseudooceanicola nanhaiensis]MCA0921297.1 isocitrate lyase/PEP mutase family protein [Pseudooceanicola nanhaiensis]
MTKPTSALRALLARDGQAVFAPGAYDALLAKLVEKQGFEAVYMTGAGVSGALGLPDLGLLSMSEITDVLRRMVKAVKVPVIADADTGYGNELNVVHAVREFEATGCAGLHIEDQEFPKKCGHLADKQIAPLDEYVRKIRAAVYARQDPDFLIIARSDARAKLGFEESVRRVNAALDAGADIGFVEAPETMEEVEAIPKLVNGPCMINIVRGGMTPIVSNFELQKMGYKIVITPGMALMTVITAYEACLKGLKETGTIPEPLEALSIVGVLERVDIEQWEADRKFVSG